MAPIKQIVQIVFDIVDQCYDLPSLWINKIVDTGVFAVKMLGPLTATQRDLLYK